MKIEFWGQEFHVNMIVGCLGGFLIAVMASMFGFPHFVLAKTQPAQDGRFGYWYADVRMENVE